MNNQGETKRQQQYARMIREELSAVFQKDKRDMFGNAFVTITTVRMSPDLSIARIYFTCLALGEQNPNTQQNKADEVLEIIAENKKNIRQALGQRIGKIVRIIPELIFFKDDTAEYASKIEELLQKIQTPPTE
jgi:ribosome-binding factor A